MVVLKWIQSGSRKVLGWDWRQRHSEEWTSHQKSRSVADQSGTNLSIVETLLRVSHNGDTLANLE